MHQSLVILLALPLGIYLGVSLIIHHPLNNLLLLPHHRQVHQVLHDRPNSTYKLTWLKDDCLPICCSSTVVGTVYLCKIGVEERGNAKILTFYC